MAHEDLFKRFDNRCFDDRVIRERLPREVFAFLLRVLDEFMVLYLSLLHFSYPTL